MALDKPAPNDLSAFWMPFTANRQFKANPRMITGAKDMHYHTSDGREVLDAVAGLWCCNAGHNRPRIVEAIQRQAAELDYSPAFQMGHPLAFELATRLADLAPEPLNHVFYTNSGSESVETALKIALAYHRAKGEGSRTRLIGREKGYHGVNFGGISVGGITNNRRFFGQLLAGVDHLPATILPENRFSKGQPPHGAHLADELERHGGAARRGDHRGPASSSLCRVRAAMLLPARRLSRARFAKLLHEARISPLIFDEAYPPGLRPASALPRLPRNIRVVPRSSMNNRQGHHLGAPCRWGCLSRRRTIHYRRLHAPAPHTVIAAVSWLYLLGAFLLGLAPAASPPSIPTVEEAAFRTRAGYIAPLLGRSHSFAGRTAEGDRHVRNLGLIRRVPARNRSRRSRRSGRSRPFLKAYEEGVSTIRTDRRHHRHGMLDREVRVFCVVACYLWLAGSRTPTRVPLPTPRPLLLQSRPLIQVEKSHIDHDRGDADAMVLNRRSIDH